MNAKWLIVLAILFIGLSSYLVLTNKNRPSLPFSQQHAITPTKTPDPIMLTRKAKYSVKTSEVVYFDETTGFLAKPKDEGNFPGIIMVHERWGLTEYMKNIAKQLASQGYIVLAVDLHKGTVAKTSDDAQKLVASLDQPTAIANMYAAIDLLKQQGATKVGALGWGFGGGQVLQFALTGQPLDATILYYGSLETDKAKLAKIQTPILGVFGDNDQSISLESIKEFKAGLDALEIENEIYIYQGVRTAFANPSDANYAPVETKTAWENTLEFFQKYLQNKE